MTKLASQKTILRRMMREKLRAQTASQIVAASQQIVMQLSAIGIEGEAVALFLAQPSEPNLDEFARALMKKGTPVFAPHAFDDETFFGEIAPDWSNVFTNARGWREPREYSQSQASAALRLQTIVLPALAFDSSGNRLGQGGGWYDRALEKSPAGVLRVGVCFDFQIVDTIPHEAHDQRVSVIVTERRTIQI
jgi:5-formyltetrahydrofolate cyclo-ligase